MALTDRQPTGKSEPIPLDAAFPVSPPDINVRGEIPRCTPHLHDCPEFGYCYDGSGLFVAGERIFPFQAGDAIFVSFREVHIARATQGAHVRCGWFHFDPAGLFRGLALGSARYLDTERFSGPEFHNILTYKEMPELAATVRAVLEELQARKDGWQEMVRARLWLALQLLDRLYPDLQPPADGSARFTGAEMERLLPLLRHIDQHYAEELDIDDLSRRFSMSGSTLRRLFQGVMGCSPRAYLTNFRLNMALTMLRTGDNAITEVAAKCGFRNLSNFNRQFQSRFGYSPRQARKEARP